MQIFIVTTLLSRIDVYDLRLSNGVYWLIILDLSL